jgi:hypothetical protein
MHLNPLRDIVPVPSPPPGLPLRVSQQGVPDLDAFRFVDAAFERRAFIVDKSCKLGLVAMVFLSDSGEGGGPSFWFQDRALGWHFLAASFTEYLRLLVCHIGLPLWQYAFTPYGIDPST